MSALGHVKGLEAWYFNEYSVACNPVLKEDCPVVGTSVALTGTGVYIAARGISRVGSPGCQIDTKYHVMHMYGCAYAHQASHMISKCINPTDTPQAAHNEFQSDLSYTIHPQLS